jgi:elongation factor P
MIASTQLRNGTTYLRNGEPCQVVRYALIKMGRGGATVKVTVRNLLTGAVVDDSYSSNIKVEPVTTTKRRLQYLFSDGSTVTLMDPTSFEQVEIPHKVVADQLAYIKEGDSVDVLFWDERVLSIDLPPKVTLTVTDTAPGVKGNSAANLYKQATLENGLSVRVPLFINAGEKVRVDTRTGEYVERAK